MKKSDLSKVRTILDLSITLLNNAKNEEDCTDKENELYDELANIKEVIYDFLEIEEKNGGIK